MRNPPGFFTLATLTGFTAVIGVLCAAAILQTFVLFIHFPKVLMQFIGFTLITIFVTGGLFIWLRRCDARVEVDVGN
jgi:hypothetical protein